VLGTETRGDARGDVGRDDGKASFFARSALVGKAGTGAFFRSSSARFSSASLRSLEVVVVVVGGGGGGVKFIARAKPVLTFLFLLVLVPSLLSAL
jgi:hypothetical protein